MLLYLVKHSRPDIANATRELSKCMDRATPAAFKEMLRVIKFVPDTKDYGLKIRPLQLDLSNPKWNLVVYSDSDWAGDKEKRTSVTGFIIFFMDVPIIWKSKAQASVALSSTKAEYYAISEAAKEAKFVYQLLKGLGIEIELPIIMRVDNVGAIFMSENPGGSSRTRHIDTRYHFVKEFIEDGFIKIIFVKSAENKSDGFTKNTSSDV